MEDNHPAPVQRPPDDGRVALVERSILVLLVIGLLVGVLAIVKPFTTAILFGAALAIAAWPLRQALVRRGVRRTAAAWTLLVCALILIVVPVLVIAPPLAEQLGQGFSHVQSYFAVAPKLPGWVIGLPLVGERLNDAWNNFIAAGGDWHTVLEPYTATLEHSMLGAAHALADSVLQVLLSLAVATMFWINGEALAAVLHDALRRLGGPAAGQALNVAAAAIRGVAYGVVGTAAIQTVLLVIGLVIAGIPGTIMLGFVAFLLAISQIGGPLLILIWGGSAWWLFTQDHQAWGVFMIIWGVFISTADNFIKPWLIGFGIDMPMSLTILGVFGGFITFGFLGLFIGPILIAIMFTLLKVWRATVAIPPAP